MAIKNKADSKKKEMVGKMHGNKLIKLYREHIFSKDIKPNTSSGHAQILMGKHKLSEEDANRAVSLGERNLKKKYG